MRLRSAGQVNSVSNLRNSEKKKSSGMETDKIIRKRKENGTKKDSSSGTVFESNSVHNVDQNNSIHRRRRRQRSPPSLTILKDDNLDAECTSPHIPMHSSPSSVSSSTADDDEFDEGRLNDFSSSHFCETKRSDSLPNSSFNRLQGDRAKIILLTFLYVLQGIPLGLAGAIPMVLQSRNISYKDQATFSFVYWPFSIKLLWAPIVDSIYLHRFGRRKSWLIPVQYLIGLFLYILSRSIDHLLGDGGSQTNIYLLTLIFFALNFLAATQDIVVDGWALTMLRSENVGWASTCNTVGQTAGYFLGNVLFLALESASFCNEYLRSVPQEKGLVTLSGFFYFWAIVFVVSTSLVGFIKREKEEDDYDIQDVVGTYEQLWKIVRLPAVWSYLIIIMTAKIGFAVTDSATGLKLIEAGMPKEKLAMLAVPLIPLQIILPLIISRYTAGPKPLKVFVKAYPFRLLMSFEFAFVVWWASYVKNSDGTFPTWFYVFIVISYGVHQISLYSMFVTTMGFHARISDPSIGGTYMTLLNTLSNLGANWPATLSLYFLDYLTWRSCVGAKSKITSSNGSTITKLLPNISDCSDLASSSLCSKYSGKCEISVDGYYVETAICVIIGFCWIRWKFREIYRLSNLPRTAWKV